jgi:hypothetical protein
MAGHWVAGASLFSGRPDPTWPVSAKVARKLEALWHSLGEFSGRLPSPPPLGYRGCFLRDDRGREWRAFEGVVTLLAGSRAESRRDETRSFERMLLASAPAGALPEGLARWE